MNVRTLDQRLDDQLPDGDELLGYVLTLLHTFVAYPCEHAALGAHAMDCTHAFDGALGQHPTPSFSKPGTQRPAKVARWKSRRRWCQNPSMW